MARFEYVDKNGENDMGAECSIWADSKTGTIHVGVYQGDLDGDSYTIYVPNHRAKLLGLIDDLTKILDATADWPQGYDGFCFNQAHAVATGRRRYDPVDMIGDKEDGEIHWF
jgi:hypothetical protein